MWNTVHSFQNISNALKDDGEWQLLGAQLNDEIDVSYQKMSLARKCMHYDILKKGQVAKWQGIFMTEFVVDTELAVATLSLDYLED